MEKREIKIKSTKIKIFSFFDRANLINNKKEFVYRIGKDIKELNNDSRGFAGFLDEKGFRYHLNFFNYGEKINLKYPLNKLSLNECSYLTENALNKILNILDKREIHLYLFPTLSKFIIEKMNGISGRWIWKNVIYLDIYPKRKWGEYFEDTLIHEIAHSISDYYSDDISIGEGLIFEGLAEHFREFVTKRGKSPWTRTISEKNARSIFNEIKPILEERNFDKYNEIFFGTGKYPNWTGYTIGYYLIKKYLKKRKNVDWKELLRKNPKEILEEFRNNKLSF